MGVVVILAMKIQFKEVEVNLVVLQRRDIILDPWVNGMQQNRQIHVQIRLFEGVVARKFSRLIR